MVLFRPLKIPARCQNMIFKKLKTQLFFKKMALIKSCLKISKPLVRLTKDREKTLTAITKIRTIVSYFCILC